MDDVYHIFGAVMLLVSLIAAGIVLRTTASLMQQYASREGTPYMGTGVRVVGLIIFGVGAGLAGLTSLYAATRELKIPDQVLITIGLAVTAYLLFAGAVLFILGRQLGSPQKSVPGEWGTRLVIALAWCAAALSLVVCCAAYFVPALVLGVAPVLMLVLLMLLFTEAITAIGRRGHRRTWSLWQVCLAIRSRQPLSKELANLSDYSWGAQRRQLQEMSDEVREGVSTETVLIRPAFLSSMEGAQIATGMKSGRLPEVLGELLERRTAQMNDLHASQDRFIAALHLSFTLFLLAGVGGFIMYWIIPKFKKIFDDFGTDLPELTKIVIQGSSGVADYAVLVVPFVGLLVAGSVLLAAVPFVSSFLRLREWLSRLWPRICLPDILRSLSLAVGARIPLEEALVPFVRRQFQVPLHSRLVRVQEAIREGADCWNEMTLERLLTPTEAAMLQSAQRAGNLPWALKAIGQRCEQRWRFQLMFCLEFVQPALLLAVAVLVGTFVIALFLPLVKLLNDLS